jgi:predicted transcriptional regulator
LAGYYQAEFMECWRSEEVVATAKEEVRKILDEIPDDASFEDIQYHIYVREKIDRGLKDIEEGRVLSQEEVEQRMSKWLGR